MIENILKATNAQHSFFASGATLNLKFRKEMLKKLMTAIEKWEPKLHEALWMDLHKSYQEAYMTETSIVKSEIKSHIRHLSKWAARRKVSTPLKLFPSRSYIVKEPLGCSLIISPWNYPVQLLLNPLVGAISAGCTAILKPSPYVPRVSQVIADMIAETFCPDYITVIQGHRDVNEELLKQRFDLIFFTGSPQLGKKVMEAASKNLTPVILELGGKSPCIVDKTADIKTAAKRIAWGKTLNSGQTCIAPDYLILHSEIKAEFISEFGKAVRELHGDNIQNDEHYVRMVNSRAFERVASYIPFEGKEGVDGRIVYGGRVCSDELFIEPTLIDEISPDSPVMMEEIFGPVFPIITLDDNGKSFSDKVLDFVSSREKPLAFYWFGNEKKGWEVISKSSSGGACINDVIMHIANENIPFGGVGNSGMGHYHKKESFEAFSHTRSIVSTATWIDLPFRYMPYKMFSLVKKIL